MTSRRYLDSCLQDAPAQLDAPDPIDPNRISKLYDENATKENILQNLRRIVKKTKKGDSFYLFFSGHGTSAYDPSLQNNQKLKNMLKDTGGLIPWGISIDDYESGLIIAKKSPASS